MSYATIFVVTENFAEQVNRLDGWLQAMGITVTHATADEVRAELTIGPEHLQGYGIVHGGVHCGLIESLASIGAALVALPRNQTVVGLENNTSFIRAVRSGLLRAAARPVTRGRSSQVWEAWIRDAEGKLVAQGRVRLLCLEANRELG